MDVKPCTKCIVSPRRVGHSMCDPCRAEYNSAWYARNKAAQVARARKNELKYIVLNRQFVLAHLREHPCVDCGETDVRVLEFDHVIGRKKNNVSTLARRAVPLETLKEEIEKCVVRCANCHRRITCTRQGWWKGKL